MRLLGPNDGCPRKPREKIVSSGRYGGAIARLDGEENLVVRAVVDGVRADLNFGAYSRGEADSESDIDVLAVLDEFDYCGAELHRCSHRVADLSLKYDVSVNQVFMRERDGLRHETPFLMNVRNEAISE